MSLAAPKCPGRWYWPALGIAQRDKGGCGSPAHRQVAFDRLLARLFRVDSVPWVLKGGYAFDLRFRTTRSTVDIA